MKCLIIEDDPFKMNHLESLMQKEFPLILVKTSKSYMSGINFILSEDFELILLDMSLPLYDDETYQSSKPKNFGGRDILKEMKRNKKISLVKVITQYNEFDDGSISMKDLDEQLKKIYPNIYQGYIHYETRFNQWEPELIEFIKTIFQI